MTLVIAAQGKNFMILGTDSRGTIQDRGGTRVELNIMDKLVVISKHVAILMHGSAEYGDYLIEKFKLTLRGQNHNVSDIAEKFAETCREEGRNLMGVPSSYLPSFGFVISGLDKKGDKYVPRSYYLTSDSGFWLRLPKHGFALEGKSMIAYYLFARKYSKDMDVDGLCTLVAQTLYDTKSVDGDVGGKIRVAIIEKDGFREYPEGDINSWIDKWQQ